MANRDALRVTKPVAFGSEDYPQHFFLKSPIRPPFFGASAISTTSKNPMPSPLSARATPPPLARGWRAKLASDLGAAGLSSSLGSPAESTLPPTIAALETGTIAMMAGGVDVIYPAENAVLGQEIGERACVISECAMSVTPRAPLSHGETASSPGWLARATVVVEAAAKSGSLITARTALDQGRDVLAVPGTPSMRAPPAATC